MRSLKKRGEVPEGARKTRKTMRKPRVEADGPDLSAAAKARAAIDAGDASRPDEGKPAGAGNALTFHNWSPDAGEED